MRVMMTKPFTDVKGPMQEHIPLLISELKKKNIDVIEFNYGKANFKNNFFLRYIHSVNNLVKFIKVIYSKKPDIIQINSSFDKSALVRDSLFLSTAKIFHKRIFIKFHGSFYTLLHTNNFLWKSIAHFLFFLADTVGVLSSMEKQEFAENYISFRDKFIVVKNLIDNRMFQAPPRKTYLKRGKIKVLFASRMIEKKGVFDLIHAIPYVINEIDAHFIFVGDGRDAEKAKMAVSSYNLNFNVSWLGYIPSIKMKSIYLNADLLVFPSHFPEGMPMVLVYGIAAGLPIITTRVRFTYDYFREKKNCLFISTSSPKEIASKIIHLAKNPHIMNHMSKFNFPLSIEFNKDVVSNEYIEIYKKIHKGKNKK